MTELTLILPDDLNEALEARVQALNADGAKPKADKRNVALAILADALGVPFEPRKRGGWQGNPRSLKNLKYVDKDEEDT